MNGTSARQTLVAAVAGDLQAFTRLLAQPPASIDAQTDSLPELTVTREGIIRVLVALQQKDASPELVQQWASFVRWGYFGSVEGHRRPLDIQYDHSVEDQIVEVLARLDELGDVIDGDISDAEIQELIKSLMADESS
jgi:hypothetical protein